MSKQDLRQAAHYLDCTRLVHQQRRKFLSKTRRRKQRLIITYFYEEWVWRYVMAALELYANHHGSLKEQRKRQRERRRHNRKYGIVE